MILLTDKDVLTHVVLNKKLKQRGSKKLYTVTGRSRHMVTLQGAQFDDQLWIGIGEKEGDKWKQGRDEMRSKFETV